MLDFNNTLFVIGTIRRPSIKGYTMKIVPKITNLLSGVDNIGLIQLHTVKNLILWINNQTSLTIPIRYLFAWETENIVEETLVDIDGNVGTKRRYMPHWQFKKLTFKFPDEPPFSNFIDIHLNDDGHKYYGYILDMQHGLYFVGLSLIEEDVSKTSGYKMIMLRWRSGFIPGVIGLIFLVICIVIMLTPTYESHILSSPYTHYMFRMKLCLLWLKTELSM